MKNLEKERFVRYYIIRSYCTCALRFCVNPKHYRFLIRLFVYRVYRILDRVAKCNKKKTEFKTSTKKITRQNLHHSLN